MMLAQRLARYFNIRDRRTIEIGITNENGDFLIGYISQLSRQRSLISADYRSNGRD
jgi:hypothetical protein